jgi:hypothetical protein
MKVHLATLFKKSPEIYDGRFYKRVLARKKRKDETVS